MGKAGKGIVAGGRKGTRPDLQHGALCYRLREGKPEVLLITSRGTGRWIIPKGWPVPGEDGAGSALVEAWEEAGVRGKAGPAPLGRYGYRKALQGGEEIPLTVEVWPVAVEKLASRFPERKERRRKWFSPKKAARKVHEAELAELIRRFGKTLEEMSGESNDLPENPGSSAEADQTGVTSR